MSGDDRRGFGRVVDAAKGLGKLCEFLASEDDKLTERNRPTEPPPPLPAKPHACPRPQPAGWICVLTEPHAECLIERYPPEAS